MKKYWSSSDKAKRKANSVPGWLMSKAQIAMYWRMFADICRVMRFDGTAADKEEFRKDWHEQSTYTNGMGREISLGRCSAKEISPLKGYDAIKRTWLAITQPDNVHAQVAMLRMQRTRIIYKITRMADERFWRALLASDRFKKQELDELDDVELENFRMTLAARICAAQREVSAEPTAEEKAMEEEMSAGILRDARGSCANCSGLAPAFGPEEFYPPPLE